MPSSQELEDIENITPPSKDRRKELSKNPRRARTLAEKLIVIKLRAHNMVLARCQLEDLNDAETGAFARMKAWEELKGKTVKKRGPLEIIAANLTHSFANSETDFILCLTNEAAAETFARAIPGVVDLTVHEHWTGIYNATLSLGDENGLAVGGPCYTRPRAIMCAAARLGSAKLFARLQVLDVELEATKARLDPRIVREVEQSAGSEYRAAKSLKQEARDEARRQLAQDRVARLFGEGAGAHEPKFGPWDED